MPLCLVLLLIISLSMLQLSQLLVILLHSLPLPLQLHQHFPMQVFPCLLYLMLLFPFGLYLPMPTFLQIPQPLWQVYLTILKLISMIQLTLVLRSHSSSPTLLNPQLLSLLVLQIQLPHFLTYSFPSQPILFVLFLF